VVSIPFGHLDVHAKIAPGASSVDSSSGKHARRIALLESKLRAGPGMLAPGGVASVGVIRFNDCFMFHCGQNGSAKMEAVCLWLRQSLDRYRRSLLSGFAQLAFQNRLRNT
jgi:hypothetical protein